MSSRRRAAASTSTHHQLLVSTVLVVAGVLLLLTTMTTHPVHGSPVSSFFDTMIHAKHPDDGESVWKFWKPSRYRQMWDTDTMLERMKENARIQQRDMQEAQGTFAGSSGPMSPGVQNDEEDEDEDDVLDLDAQEQHEYQAKKQQRLQQLQQESPSRLGNLFQKQHDSSDDGSGFANPPVFEHLQTAEETKSTSNYNKMQRDDSRSGFANPPVFEHLQTAEATKSTTSYSTSLDAVSNSGMVTWMSDAVYDLVYAKHPDDGESMYKFWKPSRYSAIWDPPVVEVETPLDLAQWALANAGIQVKPVIPVTPTKEAQDDDKHDGDIVFLPNVNAKSTSKKQSSLLIALWNQFSAKEGVTLLLLAVQVFLAYLFLVAPASGSTKAKTLDDDDDSMDSSVASNVQQAEYQTNQSQLQIWMDTLQMLQTAAMANDTQFAERIKSLESELQEESEYQENLMSSMSSNPKRKLHKKQTKVKCQIERVTKSLHVQTLSLELHKAHEQVISMQTLHVPGMYLQEPPDVVESDDDDDEEEDAILKALVEEKNQLCRELQAKNEALVQQVQSLQVQVANMPQTSSADNQNDPEKEALQAQIRDLQAALEQQQQQQVATPDAAAGDRTAAAALQQKVAALEQDVQSKAERIVALEKQVQAQKSMVAKAEAITRELQEQQRVAEQMNSSTLQMIQLLEEKEAQITELTQQLATLQGTDAVVEEADGTAPAVAAPATATPPAVAAVPPAPAIVTPRHAPPVPQEFDDGSSLEDESSGDEDESSEAPSF